MTSIRGEDSDDDSPFAREQEKRRKAEELVDRRDAICGGHLDLEEEQRRLAEIAEEYEADVRRKAAGD